MYHVYLLKSLKNSSKTYIGFTTNLNKRIQAHNYGESEHRKQDKPWKLVFYLAFESKQKALNFERYIKAGSGYAFAKKRFW